MKRTDPDTEGGELALLTQFLDYHRDTLLWKVEGLTADQLAQRIPSSELTLAGLLKHLALVEDSWFRRVMMGQGYSEPWASVDWEADPDWEFHSALEDSPVALVEGYQAACARSRAIVAEVGNLDTIAAKPSRSGEQFNLRWILLHMIEETARHNGHADLLRENIDGVTGE